MTLLGAAAAWPLGSILTSLSRSVRRLRAPPNMRPTQSRSCGMADPVADELVASLARPGGNVTGTTFLGPELVGKRLQLLRQVVPGLGAWRRFGIRAPIANAPWPACCKNSKLRPGPKD